MLGATLRRPPPAVELGSPDRVPGRSYFELCHLNLDAPCGHSRPPNRGDGTLSIDARLCYQFRRVGGIIWEISGEVPCSKPRYPSRRQNRLRSLFLAFRHVTPLRNRPNRHQKSHRRFMHHKLTERSDDMFEARIGGVR